MSEELHVVTGAFGYSGRYVTELLLQAGRRVRTLTGSPDRPNSFGDRIEVRPWCWDDPAKLAENLRGARVLYNTYWVRFNWHTFKHGEAVENTLKLFEAAKQAGVERVVHVSITNPSEDSELEYFRGKAVLEKALKESGLSYAILRPAVLFGGEDILINNIAWVVRRFPVVGMFGRGKYRLQPIHVEDFAKLAVELGQERENKVVDGIGPETFTYRELLQALCKILGKRRWLLPLPPYIAYLCGKLLGWITGDVMITREEIRGLMDDLLVTDSPPAGTTKLTDWARENRDRLGVRYASELARRKNREKAYGEL